ncbi:MAG: RNA methyltransferase [Spirochaetia bacterium]|nr:RNA methyltransferase [Spirochaetia bacterium]
MGQRAELMEFLSTFLTPDRIARIKEVLARRTNHLTVVLEDIYDPHNASAVLRSCDAMGVQTVHVIQDRHRFHLNEAVAMGSGKWLDLVYYQNTESCFTALRAQGYFIAAASPPNARSVYLGDFQKRSKTAIVMGSERDGLSSYARNNSDALLTIPMRGFAESFNLSVSAALLIFNLGQEDLPPLSSEELDDVEFRWITSSLRNPEELIRRFESKDAPET